MLSFSLCQGNSRVVCVCFMIHNAFLWAFTEFISGPKTALLIHSYTHTRAPSTKLIHGKQNPPIVIQTGKCIMSLFWRTTGTSGPKAPALIISLSSSGGLSCDPLSGPIPDYPAPAAGAAERLHYVSEVPDERGNGVSAVWSLPMTSVKM